MSADARKKRRLRDKRTIQRYRERIIRAAGGSPRCHLCGKPIDPDLPQYDPGALELDHLDPVSRSTARHTRFEDVAASHRKCNKARGAKPVGEARVMAQGFDGLPLPPPGEYRELPDGSGWLNSMGGVSSRPW